MTDRDLKYLAFVHGFESCLSWADGEPWPEDDGCTRLPVHGVVAHHIRMGNRAGTSQKPSDYFTVPLTDAEHKKLHNYGEREFWKLAGIDPRRIMVALLMAFVGYQVERGKPFPQAAADAHDKLIKEIEG